MPHSLLHFCGTGTFGGLGQGCRGKQFDTAPVEPLAELAPHVKPSTLAGCGVGQLSPLLIARLTSAVTRTAEVSARRHGQRDVHSPDVFKRDQRRLGQRANRPRIERRVQRVLQLIQLPRGFRAALGRGNYRVFGFLIPIDFPPSAIMLSSSASRG